MNKKIDIIGKKFGKLTVIEFSHYQGGHIYYRCICECGKIVYARRSDFIRKQYPKTSCGCEQWKFQKKHNSYKEKLYNCWIAMKQRCLNPQNRYYKNYGARGISICEEWKNNYVIFQKWAKENGYKEGLSIERKDVNGNYCPDNCKWITLPEQLKNTTRNHYIEINGERKILKEWSEIGGFPYSSFYPKRKKTNSDAEAVISLFKNLKYFQEIPIGNQIADNLSKQGRMKYYALTKER